MLWVFWWNLMAAPWQLYEEPAARLREFESLIEGGAGRAHRGALRAETDVCKQFAEDAFSS
jgi:hypothetical protein